MTPIRITICRETLEAAKAAGNGKVIDACRRIINAYYIGRDKALKADWQTVYGAAK